MVTVSRSRHTPGIKAHETRFRIGDVVTYELEGREQISITIANEFMHHKQARIGGYEAKFSDDGKIGFADVERIVDWRGKDQYRG